MAEDNKLRVHGHPSTGRPRNARSQIETDYSSLPQIARDLDRNPVSRLSDDMNAIQKQKGNPAKLYSSYYPSMQTTVHHDSASATFAASSQRVITEQRFIHEGARPKTQQSKAVIGVSCPRYEDSVKADDMVKKSLDTSSTRQKGAYKPEKYGTPTQAENQIESSSFDDSSANKGPKIYVKVLSPGNTTIEPLLIDCDIEMYMKWQLILRSPTRLNETNKQFEALCQITHDSLLKIFSFNGDHRNLKEITKMIISAVIENLGKHLKVECLFVSGDEALPIAEQLMKLPIFSVLRILYAEAITDESIYLVYEKSKETAVKQQIEEKYERFSVRVKLPLFWKKLSERIKLKENLQEKYPGVSVSFFECQDTGSYVCNIFSQFFKATETAGKVIFYRDNVLSKSYPLTSNMKQAFKSLNLCETFQRRIDKKVNSACLIVETEKDLQLLGFRNEYLNTGMRIVQAELDEKFIDLRSDMLNRENLHEFQRKMDADFGKQVLMVTKDDGFVFVGLKIQVKMATDTLNSLLIDFSDEESVHVFSRKTSLEDEDLLDTLTMLAEDIAKLNKVEVNIEKTFRGNSVTFIDSKEKSVEKTIKDFNAAKIDVKKEVISIEKSVVNGEHVSDLVSRLQEEYKVKVLVDKITGYDRSQDEAQKGRIIWNKDKSGCTWMFPSGRKLNVDILDIDHCTEPEVIVVIAEKKSSISGFFSSLSGLASKQKKVDMNLPKQSESEKGAEQKVRNSIRKLLKKLSDQGYRSIGFIIASFGDWPFLQLADTLLTPILKYAADFEGNDGLQEFTFCCDTLDKYKKVEGLIRSSIGDPSFDEEEIQIEVFSGELNEFEADILVNTTSPTLDLNYGSVSSAILKTAGQELQLECKQKYPEGVHGQNVAVTRGYGLKCQYVIHGALHKYSNRNQTRSLQELRDFLQSCLHQAVRLKVSSIAFPVIGSGNLGFPADLVASEMFTAVEKLKQTEQEYSLQFVYFVVYHKDRATLEVFKRVHADMVKHSPKHCKVSSDSSDLNPTQSGLVMVKVIGKTSSVDQAVKAIKNRYNQSVCGSDKQELAESEMCQMIDDVLPYEYASILRHFPAEVEKINDSGVKLQFENNMIEFKGKIDKILESVKEMKAVLQDLRSMYHIRVSIRETKKSQIKNTLKQISAQFPEVYYYFDEIMAIIYMYGRKPYHVKDVEEAGRLLGYNKEKRQDGRPDTTEDKMSKPAMYKPVVQRNFSWTLSAKKLRVYQAGGVEVKVYEGDLLEAPVDCIVNAANKDLNHAGGVAYSIATRAGEEVKKQCFYIVQQAPLAVGSVVETTAGHLSYKYILHTVGPCWFDYQPITKNSLKKCEDDLFMAISNTFRKAEELKIESIALPAISSAIFRVPVEICALQYGMAVLNFAKGTTYLKNIYFVDKDLKTIAIIQNAFKCLISEDRPFDVNRLVYLDVTERKNSNSTRRNSQKTRNEIDNENDSSMGGMVLYETFCRMEGSKMICVFTTCQEIHIYTGDILGQKDIDAIVCSEDRSFSAAGIVARELLKHGGEEYKKAKAEAHRQHPTMDEGDVIISDGGKNKFSSVIHALIPNSKPIEYLKDLLENILENCVRNGYKSVVMSLLGSGQGKQHPELCSRQLLLAYKNFCFRNPGYKFTLYIINIKKDITTAIQSTFTEHINSQSLAMQSQQMSGYRNSKGKAELKSGKLSSTENHLPDKVKNPQTPQNAAGSLNRSLKSSLKNADSKDGQLLKKTSADGDNKISGRYKEDSNDGQKSCKQNTDKDKEVTEELTATCVICLDKLENPKTLKCGHVFCADCIDQYFKVKPVCPTCFTVCGVITGNQPNGVMEIMKLKTSVTGYEGYGTLGVSYRFENGRQGDEHPDPGAWYHGINRTAYLPNTEEGRKICAMLRLAFERRLVFTIGTSRTTGQEGVITWNDIHHKTDHRPNTQFGYPDATYLTRVKEELAIKGVMEEDIDKDCLKSLNEPTFNHKDICVYSESR